MGVLIESRPARFCFCPEPLAARSKSNHPATTYQRHHLSATAPSLPQPPRCGQTVGWGEVWGWWGGRGAVPGKEVEEEEEARESVSVRFVAPGVGSLPHVRGTQDNRRLSIGR